ncbi:MAG TPA: hypothetical protein VFF68_11485 [Anaerolineaceae bacterium]|nr:hypothetical protein [Anaerolineaceae bacterium]
MNPKDPARVLDEISTESVPQDLNLLPGVMAKIQQGPQPMFTTASKLRLAALLLVLILLVTYISVPGAAAALQKLIGYIPGVGPVDQSAPLRVLAEPVTAAQNGYTITVDSALLDSTRTVISYRITGQFPVWDDPTLEPGTCQEFPILRLPDGSELIYPSREHSLASPESHWKDIFTAVPADQNSAVLVLPCLAALPVGEGPQNWEIPLDFVPAPPELTVFPVVEQPTAGPDGPQEPAVEVGMQLNLLGVAALDDGYFLQAELRWQPDPATVSVQFLPEAIHLVDAAGQELPVWPSDSMPPMAFAESGRLPLDLQTGLVTAAGPAQLVVDYVAISLPAQASLTLDVGEHPQPGQTWAVNQDLEINGYRLRVLSAEYVQPVDGQDPWLELNLSAGPEVVAVTAMDTQHEIIGTGGSPNSEQFPFRTGWRYKGDFPSGPITVEITTLTVRREGPWSLEWTPPAAANPVATPTAASRTDLGEACLAESALKQASIGLPEGLDGRVVFMEEAGDRLYDLFASRLDGSERQALGSGLFPDLSPDGQRVVYQGPQDGLYLRNLADEASVLIPGTLEGEAVEFRPKWSPDGRWIAFEMYFEHTKDIYLVDGDGTNLRPAGSGPEPASFLGWGPDSSRLYYWVTNPEDNSGFVRSLDLQSGATAEVTQLPSELLFPTLSPDARQLMLMTEPDLILRDLASDEERLIVAGPHSFSNQTFSPDGRWIAMAHWEPFGSGANEMVLLDLNTCQAFRLPEQTAHWLLSWVP